MLSSESKRGPDEVAHAVSTPDPLKIFAFCEQLCTVTMEMTREV